MKIKGRQGLASGHDLASPGHCLEEPLEFGLTFNDDSPAPLGHQRQVTDELKGIPKALLGVEQKGAIFQWASRPIAAERSFARGRKSPCISIAIHTLPSPVENLPASAGSRARLKWASA